MAEGDEKYRSVSAFRYDPLNGSHCKSPSKESQPSSTRLAQISMSEPVANLQNRIEEQAKELRHLSNMNERLAEKNDTLERQNFEFKNEVRYLQEMLIKRSEHCTCQELHNRISSTLVIGPTSPGSSSALAPLESPIMVKYSGDPGGTRSSSLTDQVVTSEASMTPPASLSLSGSMPILDRKLSYADSLRRATLDTPTGEVNQIFRFQTPPPSRTSHMYMRDVMEHYSEPPGFSLSSALSSLDTYSEGGLLSEAVTSAMNGAKQASDPRVHCTVHPYLCWVGWSPSKPLNRQQLQAIFQLNDDRDIVYMRNDYGFVSFRNKELFHQALRYNNREIIGHGVIKVERARRNIWWDELPFNMT